MLSYISMTFKKCLMNNINSCDICGQNVSGQRFHFSTYSCLFFFLLQLVSLWFSWTLSVLAIIGFKKVNQLIGADNEMRVLWVSEEEQELKCCSLSPQPAAWGSQSTPPRQWWACRCDRWCGSAPPCRRSWRTGCSRRDSWCSPSPGTSPSLEGRAAARPAPELSSRETSYK